jgi:flagellar basal body-associated protein FliL
MEDKKGYGKRPLWQWVVIYVVVGALAYAAIYYFFLSGNTNVPGY